MLYIQNIFSGINEEDLSNVLSQKVDLLSMIDADFEWKVNLFLEMDQVEVCELKSSIEPGIYLLQFNSY